MNKPAEIGRRLRKARERKDLSIPDVSNTVGCHPRTTRRYEAGYISSLSLLNALCDALDTSAMGILFSKEKNIASMAESLPPDCKILIKQLAEVLD